MDDPDVDVEDDHEDLWELESVTEQAQAPMLAAAQVSGEYVLSLHDYSNVEGVLRTLRDNGLEVAAMELQQPDLEEVFVAIMRRE